MGIQRAPVGSFAPYSNPAHAYIKLWREVQAKMLADSGIGGSC